VRTCNESQKIILTVDDNAERLEELYALLFVISSLSYYWGISRNS
jgi:hypothetical protein